jgi:hypothetical protein
MKYIVCLLLVGAVLYALIKAKDWVDNDQDDN